MYYDSTSAWAPTSRRGITEAMITEQYLAKHPEIQQMIKGCQEEMERLLANYDRVLGIEERLKAKTLNTFIREPMDYRRSFMVNVVFSSYHVWDESHKKYPEILKLVAEYNPEYLRQAIADHDRKLKICKVEVYHI